MNIKEKQAHETNFSKGRQSKIKYIVIHYTANNGDTAEGNCNYFFKENRNASAHYFVDENEIWQSVKDNNVAWHCGANSYKHKTCRNSNSIGIEMCSRIINGKYIIDLKTVSNAIELTKFLMKKYNISVDNILRHYDVTGKDCPRPFVENENLWLNFKARLEDEMVSNIKIKLNGRLKTVEAINKNGFNYIKIRDLEDDKIKISYDNVEKIPTLEINNY